MQSGITWITQPPQHLWSVPSDIFISFVELCSLVILWMIWFQSSLRSPSPFHKSLSALTFPASSQSCHIRTSRQQRLCCWRSGLTSSTPQHTGSRTFSGLGTGSGAGYGPDSSSLRFVVPSGSAWRWSWPFIATHRTRRSLWSPIPSSCSPLSPSAISTAWDGRLWKRTLLWTALYRSAALRFSVLQLCNS